MRAVVVLPLARLDLVEAHAWYAARQDALANDFLFQVDVQMERISEAPHQFPIILADVRRARLKRFPYSIFFRNDETIAYVLAVFHASRDPRTREERL
jgi:plasmid stabilization system protein ParE